MKTCCDMENWEIFTSAAWETQVSRHNGELMEGPSYLLVNYCRDVRGLSAAESDNSSTCSPNFICYSKQKLSLAEINHVIYFGKSQWLLNKTNKVRTTSQMAQLAIECPSAWMRDAVGRAISRNLFLTGILCTGFDWNIYLYMFLFWLRTLLA